MKKVLFLHGLESQPGGKKPKFLQGKGFEVFNPSLPKTSFDESVSIAQSIIDVESIDAVVGSSRGAAVAMCLELKGSGIVLIAPAWKKFPMSQNTDRNLSQDAMIIHSIDDEVVDYTDSEKLAKTSGAKLITAGVDHRMRDVDALEAILDATTWVTR